MCDTSPMRAVRSGWWVLLVATAALSATAVTACGSCDVDCAPDAGGERQEITATVVEVDADAGTVFVETHDSTLSDVRVFGRVEVLHPGSAYRFPLHLDGDEVPTTALPDPCDCGGPYITDLEGEVVDTAYLASLRSIDATRAGATLVGIGVVGIVLWALVRRRRGLPL